MFLKNIIQSMINVTLKNNLVDNASKFYKWREKIIKGFKNGVYPLYYDSRYHEQRMKHEEEQEEKQKPTKNDLITLNKHIIDEKTKINEKVFKNYFNFQRPSDMPMFLNKTNDKEKNNELVSLINSRLKDLKEEIKKMSKEKKIEDLKSILEIAEMILKFNKQNQQGQVIKTLTSNQILSRLPITLAQLKAGNSDKLKNEIRQLLYSLYRSKNMTKQVYNNLIKHI